MKLRTFYIIITSTLLLINCGGTKGEGTVGDVIHVKGKLPEETESIDLFWTIANQPDASKLSMKTLEFSKEKSEMSFTPDAAGKYVFEMEIFQYGDELETQKFTYVVDLLQPVVTSETEGGTLADEEDEDWLDADYDEEVEDEDYDYAEEAEGDEYDEDEEDEDEEYDYDEESEGDEYDEIEDPTATAIPTNLPAVESESTVAKPAKKKSSRYIIPFDKSRYTIQVASKKNLKDAEITAANLIESGYDAYIQKAYFRDTDEVWFRIRVGSYDNRETALAVGKVIASAMITDVWVDFVRFEE